MSRTRALRSLIAVLAATALLAAACSDDDTGEDTSSDTSTETTAGDTSSTTGTNSSRLDPEDTSPTSDGTSDDGTSGEASAAVFNAEGNNLWAYGTEPPFDAQEVINAAANDPENGLDINAQICFWDDPELGRLFIAGEDTGQPDPPAGWGIFRLDGQTVGDFAPTQIGKLTPTYQAEGDPENYGCGLLSDGRMVTTDIGNQALGAGTGQLIVWFPPFDSYEVAYCKLDVGIATAQSILVDDEDNVYVASSRGGGPADRSAGVWRYSGPFPTGPTPDEGCDGTDDTDAPMATGIERELFIPTSEESGVFFPAGLAWTPDGGMYVSSVANGVIAEFDASGAFVRTILAPPEGETLDDDSFSTGTPLGIGVGPDGTLFFADIGVVSTTEDDGSSYIGPGDGNGSVRRITFDDAGEPQAPEVMVDGLAFPDGIGIFVP